MTNEADTHAPPAGYVQAVPTITHGDQLPDGVPARAIGKADYPATIFAMNIIRMDSGGPSWPAEDAPQVPLCWHPFLPVIEDALNQLDGGDRSKVDLDSEMFIFCSGEESAIHALRDRSQGHTMASLFLNDFFEGWSYFASKARPLASEPPAEQVDQEDAHYDFVRDRDGDRMVPLPTWKRDNRGTFYRLQLVGDADIPAEQVAQWTDDQCKEADCWAFSVHLSASDNDDIIVPARPNFIPIVDRYAGRNPITGAPMEPPQLDNPPPPR